MKYFVAFLFVFTLGHSYSQDKKIDKLEILYDQGYYKKVYRKANKLMADPLYDYSGLPEYYKALSTFRLAEDEHWFKKHPKCIFDAVQLYKVTQSNEKYTDYVKAHYFELAHLKTYLVDLEKKLRGCGLTGSADELDLFISGTLNSIDAAPKPVDEPVITDDGGKEIITADSPLRDRMVIYAKSLIGIKYVWAGSDESGFDCSGFTSYVHKKYGYTISRTASGQAEESKKVKLTNAQKADLVFFSSGSRISHVGLVVSDKSDELSMVHASTSKGVIVTNVEKSTYWKPKLKSAGTYVED
ncbi:MAG: C40 family peptidase [Crocinitomicaceae bacterium]|nr:C40 family peptidase [Crocinitomicaceae bacterium]